MKPKKIKLIDQKILLVEWNENNIVEFPLKFLRDESPDAGNKGETILWKHYPPPPAGPDKPGKYEIADIKSVGNYAISITWKDGYNSGIYSWELLERFAEFIKIKSSINE